MESVNNITGRTSGSSNPSFPSENVSRSANAPSSSSGTTSVDAPSDSTGISHPRTYDSEPRPDTNVKASESDHHAAAVAQSNLAASGTSTRKPEAVGPETGSHKPTHDKNSTTDEDAEIAKKPRKDHETTTREIKATQEKAMAGTHPADKEGEALRKQLEKEEARGAPSEGLEQHESHGSHQHEAGEHVGIKDKLMGKVHHK